MTAIEFSETEKREIVSKMTPKSGPEHASGTEAVHAHARADHQTVS